MSEISKKIMIAKLMCNLLACGILNASAGSSFGNCDSISSSSNQPAPVVVSATEAPNLKERTLSHALTEYTIGLADINNIKENIKNIPDDLRSLIEDYKIAEYNKAFADRSIEKSKKSFETNRGKILHYCNFFRRKRAHFPINSSEYISHSDIITLIGLSLSPNFHNMHSLDSFTFLPDNVMNLLKKERDFLIEKPSLERALADANTARLEAYKALNEAYNKSHLKRNIDSDLKLYDLLFAAKNEFEDFIQNSNLRDLLASSRNMNLVLFEKRFIEKIVPKVGQFKRKLSDVSLKA